MDVCRSMVVELTLPIYCFRFSPLLYNNVHHSSVAFDVRVDVIAIGWPSATAETETATNN